MNVMDWSVTLYERNKCKFNKVSLVFVDYLKSEFDIMAVVFSFFQTMFGACEDWQC